MPPFHLAFPVHDLAQARHFYGDVLGCAEGRSSDHWIDFDLFGHQIVAHLDPEKRAPEPRNDVDGDSIPVFHFGVVLDFAGFDRLADQLKAADTNFLVEPRTRFAGEPGEQRTMFVTDPSGNALEFKAFASPDRIFARD